MKSRYLERRTSERDRWMISYADVLTILLIFFMIGAAKSLESRPHAATPAANTPHASANPANPANLVRAEQQLRARGLDPKLEPQGLVISLPQVILFPSGEDAVSPQALPEIAHIAEVLRDLPNDVRLVGHADTVPIHNRRFENNWQLSLARSEKILELLSSRYGIAESRLSIASFGPYHPAGPNDTLDGRASNRRVEIVILNESGPE